MCVSTTNRRGRATAMAAWDRCLEEGEEEGLQVASCRLQVAVCTRQDEARRQGRRVFGGAVVVVWGWAYYYYLLDYGMGMGR